MKKLIDSHLILCRVQEIIRDYEKVFFIHSVLNLLSIYKKCLENADLIWKLTK